MIAESFRSVRTSLQFFHKGQPKEKGLGDLVNEWRW
jgi:hypothetical protein